MNTVLHDLMRCSAAVEQLDIQKVAVTTFRILFQDENRTGPNGEITTYEEQTATMTVYLVLIDDKWKSYSPTLAGTFPPLGHFPRYTVTTEVNN